MGWHDKDLRLNKYSVQTAVPFRTAKIQMFLLFLMYISLKNSKIKFVQTWCVFESQKPQVVFGGVFGMEV